MRLPKITTVGFLFAVVAFCTSVANAQPAWPANWSTNDGLDPGAYNGIWRPVLGTNGLFYSDLLDDVTPDSTDIVGGTYPDHHTNGPFPSAFYYVDTTNIMLRMRLNDSPLMVTGGGSTTNFASYVWGFHLNTDADVDVDFTLQVDESGDGNLEIATAQPGSGPTNMWNVDLDDSIVPHLLVQELDWTNSVLLFGVYNATAIDGSHYHDTPSTDDYFLDMAVPWTLFTNKTGIGYLEPFQLAPASSTTHTQYTGINVLKDTPEGYWSADIAIPEPSGITSALLTFAGLALASSRARRR